MTISKWDDYLIHQVAEPMAQVGPADENFMDRLWFMTYADDASLQLMAGLGSHPNKGLMDAFLIVRKGGAQRNIRLSKHTGGDRVTPVIGPLSFEAVVPQEHWRIELSENEHGIGCALDFTARTPPFLFPRLGFTDQEQLHYKQPGSCSGTIIYEGETFVLENAAAVRDRSWGARKSGIVSSLSILVSIEAQFADRSVTMIYVDSTDGAFKMRQGAILGDDGSSVAIVDMEQLVTFEEGTQRLTSVTMRLTDANGRVHDIAGQAMADVCYFSGGGYDGRHGKDYGPYHVEGERWDVSKDGHVDTVFPYYSRMATFELDGQPGSGHVEAFFSQDADWEYAPTLVR